MNILLISFSGTGNTAKCGAFIHDALINKGHSVTHYIYSINNEFNYNLGDYDLIGIGYPIHAFNIAKPFLNFIKKFPKSNNHQKYFIYKTSGEPFWMNNSSSVTLARKMKRKGYQKLSEYHFLMPYNIVFRYKDEVVRQMDLYLKPLCYAYVDSLFSNKPPLIRYGIGSRIFSFLFKIEWICAPVNKLFVHSKKNCTHCNMCIKNCPMQALYVNKKGVIKTTSKCAVCMRCTYNCPNNALHYGFLNLWVVNPPYQYKKIHEKFKDQPLYINKNTKGYFKLFNKYFEKQNKFLIEHGYNIPNEDL